jgi:iron complex outermembrane recepter protein
VSTTNSEATTRGYVLASLTGNWLIRDGLRIDAGIENLFDRQYLEHLAGYNRIAGSDVPVGARLPGPGRSAFIRLRWALN